MKKLSETFFTDTEKSRISDAIIAAEKNTSGEVAVVVADKSDDYPEAEMLCGIIISGFVALILSEVFFHESLWFFLPLCLVLFIPSKLVAKKFPDLKRALTGKRRIEGAVKRKALESFYRKGLYKTRDNSGVLFFISILERKVWVLADSGIYAKIEQTALNKFAASVSEGIKKGRACDALCEAVSEAGELLAAHFPARRDDTNELSDDVMAE